MPFGLPDQVDDLRQVDDHQPRPGRQDVVRREVTVDEPGLHHRGQRVAQLVEVRREQLRARAGSGPAAARSPRRR